MIKSSVRFKIISIIMAMIFILNSTDISDLSSIGKGILTEVKKTYAVADEKENSIEITCVGNSNLYSGFSPLDLWNEYGYTSTICASARQTLGESYYILQKHFVNQNPELVIIETDMLFDHRPNDKNYCEKSSCITNVLNKINPIYLKQDLSSVISIISHNSPTHGYRYSSKSCNFEYSDYMQATLNIEEITTENTDLMDKLINLCSDNNAMVLLVEIPSISSWNYERHNATKIFAQQRNIQFLDFNLLYDEIQLDPTQCYRDNGCHMNYKGAKAITNYIGKFIDENYNIDNRKSDTNYEVWNESYMKFFDYKLNCEASVFK